MVLIVDRDRGEQLTGDAAIMIRQHMAHGWFAAADADAPAAAAAATQAAKLAEKAAKAAKFAAKQAAVEQAKAAATDKAGGNDKKASAKAEAEAKKVRTQRGGGGGSLPGGVAGAVVCLACNALIACGIVRAFAFANPSRYATRAGGQLEGALVTYQRRQAQAIMAAGCVCGCGFNATLSRLWLKAVTCTTLAMRRKPRRTRWLRWWTPPRPPPWATRRTCHPPTCARPTTPSWWRRPGMSGE